MVLLQGTYVNTGFTGRFTFPVFMVLLQQKQHTESKKLRVTNDFMKINIATAAYYTPGIFLNTYGLHYKCSALMRENKNLSVICILFLLLVHVLRNAMYRKPPPVVKDKSEITCNFQ